MFRIFSKAPLARLARTASAAALLMAAGTGAGVANDPIASLITNSVGQSSIQPLEANGSIAFRKAANLLEDGQYAEAYAMARGLQHPVERRAIQWAAIYFGKGEVDYQSVARFAEDAPHFASASLYKTRLEQALIKGNPGANEVISLLGGEMPNTVEGQIALAASYVKTGQADRGMRIVQYIWTNNKLDPELENVILGMFGGRLTREDHWQRAVMLLMHDRATGTERIMNYLSPAQQSLAVARIAVSRKASNAAALIDRVDPAYRDHPLLWFARGQWARDNGMLTQAVDRLNSASGALPESELWWYERRDIARKLLAVGDARTAYKAAAGYTDGPEGRVVDASFHAGWIALRFLKDPNTAVTHFRKQASLSTLPTSITQSNYWLGRAYEAAGNSGAAREAYSKAAQFGQVYYGQLAREKLGMSEVGLRPLPDWQHREVAFEARETVQAVRLFVANKHAEFAEPLLRHTAYQLTDGGELLLAARLAQEFEAHNLAILIADIADGRGSALDLFAFPKDGLPTHYKIADVDRAAVYAVARQESHFDRDAISHAGARGLMQLMPATARETAGKLGLGYSASRLTSDPAYNALLGSTYLAQQLDRYDGSLVLAAAAYNAGAGNVNKWLRANGDPRSSSVDVVDWIEQIPFTETRHYVQKVLGNYQVYRTRMGDGTLRISSYLHRIPN